jgi:hypothetical protein
MMTLEITDSAAQFCLRRPLPPRRDFRFWQPRPTAEVCFHSTVNLITVRMGEASATYDLSQMTAVMLALGLRPHLRASLDGKPGRIFSFEPDMPLQDLYIVERRLWDWLAENTPLRTPATAPAAALEGDEEHVIIDNPALAYLARYAQTAVAQADGQVYLYPARIARAELTDDIRRVLGTAEPEHPWYPRWLAALARQLIDACQIDLVAAYQHAPPAMRSRIHALFAPEE